MEIPLRGLDVESDDDDWSSVSDSSGKFSHFIPPQSLVVPVLTWIQKYPHSLEV